MTNYNQDIKKSFLKNIKDRSLDSKHLYLEQGASIFYDSEETQLDIKAHGDTYVEFFNKNIESPNLNSLIIISLGAGKDKITKHLISQIQKESPHIKISYVAVDSSPKMLELNEQVFNDLKNIEQRRIVADFSDHNFQKILEKELTEEYDQRLFVFFGATIGNIKLSNISDTLQNMLKKNDILWHDAVIQKDESPISQIKRFEYYTTWTERADTRKFLLNPLQKLGINEKSGELILSMEKEEVTGTFLYSLLFEFKEHASIFIEKENIIFIEGDKINLYFIRDYIPDQFIQYMESHNFESLDFFGDKTLGLFLYKRT